MHRQLFRSKLKPLQGCTLLTYIQSFILQAAADEKIHSAVGGLNKVLVKVKGGKFLLGEKVRYFL